MNYKKEVYKNGEKVLDGGLDVIKLQSNQFEVRIPIQLLSVASSIEKKIGNEPGFSFLSKIKNMYSKVVKISDEWIIPDQEISSNELKFLNIEQYQDWNIMFYKCTPNSESSLQIDNLFLNTSFKISVLIGKEKFISASIKIPIEGAILLIETENIKIFPDLETLDIDISKIKPKVENPLEKFMKRNPDGTKDFDFSSLYIRNKVRKIDDLDIS